MFSLFLSFNDNVEDEKPLNWKAFDVSDLVNKLSNVVTQNVN